MCHPTVLFGVKGYTGLWFAKLWGKETDIWEPYTQTKTWSSFIWKLKAGFFFFLLNWDLISIYVRLTSNARASCLCFLSAPSTEATRHQQPGTSGYLFFIYARMCKVLKGPCKRLAMRHKNIQEMNQWNSTGDTAEETLVSYRTKAKQAGITVIDRRHVMFIKSHNTKLILLTKTRNQGWVKGTWTQVHKLGKCFTTEL